MKDETHSTIVNTDWHKENSPIIPSEIKLIYLMQPSHPLTYIPFFYFYKCKTTQVFLFCNAFHLTLNPNHLSMSLNILVHV